MSQAGNKAIDLANDMHDIVVRLGRELISQQEANDEQAVVIHEQKQEMTENAEQLRKMVKWYGDAIKSRQEARNMCSYLNKKLEQVQQQLEQAEKENCEVRRENEDLKRNLAQGRFAWHDMSLELQTERQRRIALEVSLAAAVNEKKLQPPKQDDNKLSSELSKGQRIMEAAIQLVEIGSGRDWQDHGRLMEALKQAVGEN